MKAEKIKVTVINNEFDLGKPVFVFVDKIEAVYADCAAKMVNDVPVEFKTTYIDTVTRSYRVKETVDEIFRSIEGE